MGFSDVNEYVRGIAYFEDLAGGATNVFPAGARVKIAGCIVSGSAARFISIQDVGNTIGAPWVIIQGNGEAPFVSARGFESPNGLEIFVVSGAANVDVTIFYFKDRED